MATVALTDVERTFLAALDALGVRYMIVGLSAAVLQGADTVTADIDLWLEDRADPRIHQAAERAGGIGIPGHFGMAPPMLGGEELGDRFDIVTNMDGLESFQTEYAGSSLLEVDGVFVRILPLERIAHSKRTAARPKDLAVLPALDAAIAAATDEEA